LGLLNYNLIPFMLIYANCSNWERSYHFRTLMLLENTNCCVVLARLSQPKWAKMTFGIKYKTWGT